MSTTPVSADRIRILTVDDHPLILEGIANVLRRYPDMELVGEASDGYEGIEAFAKLRPDVALIDLQMPGMNGIDTIAAILKSGRAHAAWSSLPMPVMCRRRAR